MATKNKNQTIHSQKLKRKVQKHRIKWDHPTIKRNRINWKTRFKMAINTYLSITILNVNGLNIPIKRQRVADWIKKQKHSIFCLQETHLRTSLCKEKILYANGPDRKAGVVILISDKIDFKTKAIKKDKGGHCLMVKGSIQEEDITILNIYSPNIRAPRYLPKY